MRPDTKNFKRGAANALGNERVQANLLGLYNGFHYARLAAADGTPDWELMREQARAIKAHTIDNLDYYLELAASSVEKAGGTVFFAKDGDAAAGYVTDLALARGVKLVIKGKSMVSEEMSLNDRLTDAGIEPVETDLGEYIIQLAGETPYHINAPAIHQSREYVTDLIEGLPGVQLPEMEQADVGCGFGGTFAVKFSEISTAMLQDKIGYINATGADAVVSCDATCLMQIGGGLELNGVDVRPVHLAQLIDERLGIEQG